MTSAFEIVPLSSTSEQARGIFYKRVFPARSQILSREWRWWYRVGESSCEPIVAVHQGEILGQAALIPVQMENDRVVEDAIWFVDFAVLTERQGAGVGSALTKRWMELCPNQLSLSMPNSFRIFKKFGWEETLSSMRCAAPIHPIKWLPLPQWIKGSRLGRLGEVVSRVVVAGAPRLKAYEVRRSDHIVHDAFAAERHAVAKMTSFRILRDPSWVDWRLTRCPFVDEHFFFEHRGAFGIARKFRSNGVERANILYVGGGSLSDQAALCRGMTRWAVSQRLDMVWVYLNDSEVFSALKMVLPSQVPVPYCIWSSKPEVRDRLILGVKGVQGIDGDNDLFQTCD